MTELTKLTMLEKAVIEFDVGRVETNRRAHGYYSHCPQVDGEYYITVSGELNIVVPFHDETGAFSEMASWGWSLLDRFRTDEGKEFCVFSHNKVEGHINLILDHHEVR